MKRMGGISFKYRIFGSSLLVAMLPLLLSSTLMLRMFTATLERQVVESGRDQCDKLTAQMTQAMTDSSDALRALASNVLVQQALVDHASDDLTKDVYLAIYHATNGVHSGAVFALYDAGGQLQFITQDYGLTAKLPVRWGLLRKAAQSDETVYITTAEVNKLDGICLQAARSIYTVDGIRVGYAVFGITTRQMARVFSGISADSASLFLLNSQGRLFFASRLDNADADAANIRTAMFFGGVPDGEANFRLFYHTDPISGSMLIFRLPAAISTGAVLLMRSISLVSAAVCLLLCVILSFQLSRSLFSPVSRMTQAMQSVQAGDLSVRIPPSERRDELGQLSESFNAMTERLEAYVDEQVQHQKDLNSAQIRQMQAQLNPHFLYNTLDTMKWMAKIRNLNEVASLASNLGGILRSSIDSEPFITLQRELYLAEQYVAIQKIRFSDSFSYVVEVAAGLGNCIVPKLILQPLVENAIIHGLDGRDGGCIVVCARQEDELLSIDVTDNGCGMTPDIVARLNSPELKLLEGHLGLFNVGRILQLYYGPGYGLHAESCPGLGTTVTVRIPLRREEDDA